MSGLWYNAGRGDSVKTERMFQILYILLQRRSVTAPQLAEMLEVSVRTIYRDIDSLSLAGVPVYTSKGKGGGISLPENYTFDKSLLSDKEQDQILLALHSTKTADDNADKLIAKLGAIFQKGFKSWIEVDFSRWGQSEADRDKFELLKRAIIDKDMLEIEYCNSYGDINKRSIKPLKLIFKDKSWYLQAYCCKACDFRLFKINRITDINLLQRKFEDEFIDLPIIDNKEYPKEQLTKVVLRFPKRLSYRVFEEFSMNEIKKTPEGDLIVSAYMPNDNWLYGYLLSFGSYVKIIEPKSVKEKVNSIAQEIISNNEL